MVQAPPLAFGTVLRRYRRAAGLSQEAVAERAGVSARTISNLERGANRAPHTDTVALLADALALSPIDRQTFVSAAERLGWPAAEGATGRDSASVLSVPFVGRRRELAVLERHLGTSGAPVLLLAGEPGIGKTRLLQAAISPAIAQGWRVLEGGCQRRDGQEPYAPLLGALQRHIQGRRPAELRRDLQGCAWLVRLLPELADGPIPPLPAWTLTMEQERRLMVSAVVRFLSNVAGPAGTLLLLDDLQWAGADALDLLAALARAAGQIPLCVVGAYRDTEGQAHDALAIAQADLAVAGLAAQERLGPLAQEEAAALLAGLLASRSAGDALPQERVLERAGGIPFFVVSWAQALLTQFDEGRAADAVPWTVEQSIHQRVAALPEAARALLGVAAVIGRAAPHALLVAVAAQTEEEVLDAVEAACRAQLMAEGTDAYRFVHDVIREVIEASLSRARRTALHRRVAEALLALSERPPVEDVAYHYAQTREHAAATLWLERAGDEAATHFASAAALEHYQRAYDHARRAGADSAVLSRLDEKVGDLHLLRLEAGPAHDAFARARANETAPSRRAVLWCKEGRVQLVQGSVPQAISAFEMALDESTAGGTAVAPTLRAEAELGCTLAHYITGAYDASEAALGRASAALGTGKPAGVNLVLRAQAAWMQAIIADTRAEYVRAENALQNLLVYSTQLHDQRGIGRAEYGLGITAWRTGRLDEAEQHCRAGLEVLAQVGDPEFESGCWWGLSCVAQDRGQTAQAKEYLERVLAIIAPAGYVYILGIGLHDLARLALNRGDLAVAEEQERRSLELRERIGDRRGIAQCWSGLGAIATERGEHVAAAVWCRRARHLGTSCGAPVTEAEAVVGQARAVLYGILARANSVAPRASVRLVHGLLDHGRALAEQHTMRETATQIALLQAELDLLRGDSEAARRAAEEALESALSCGYRRYEGLARHLLGRCALTQGQTTQAEAYLHAALALLESCEAVLPAAQVKRTLDALRAQPAEAERPQR